VISVTTFEETAATVRGNGIFVWSDSCDDHDQSSPSPLIPPPLSLDSPSGMSIS
jgi:hypothetical protein